VQDGDRFHVIPRCFEPRRDIDAVAHRVAITRVHHVAEVGADPGLDAALVRQTGVLVAALVADAH
jgi:hypothetical protein